MSTGPHDSVEQRWRQHSIESQCRLAEDMVDVKRATTVGYGVLAVLGFLVVELVAVGFFGGGTGVRVVLASLGNAAIGLGIVSVGRFLGQRSIVRRWRHALDRPMPTDETDGSDTPPRPRI